MVSFIAKRVIMHVICNESRSLYAIYFAYYKAYLIALGIGMENKYIIHIFTVAIKKMMRPIHFHH